MKSQVVGAIATPCTCMIHTEHVIAVGSLLLPGPIASLRLIGWNVAGQRNGLVRQFLQHRLGDWLLFVDSDMSFPSDALLHILSHGDRDIIGAVCLSKVPTFRPTVWSLAKRRMTVEEVMQQPVPFECWQIGMAFTLIRRRVFETLSDPWFEVGRGEGVSSDAYGEDVYFCQKARQAGFTVWADRTIPVRHLTQGGVSMSPNGVEQWIGYAQVGVVLK